MGSSSSSNSSQDTQNASTSFGIQGANNGLILNGSGNTVTDGGAFKLVGDIVDTLPIMFTQGAGMVTDGFNAVTDVALMGERQNENVLNAAVDLFGESSNAQAEMTRLGFNSLTDMSEVLSRGVSDAYDFGRDAMDNVANTTETALKSNADLTYATITGNQDLAVLVSDSLADANDNNTVLAGRAMDNSNYLAESLTKTALASGNDANEQATKQLLSGFEDMMNFADGYSRSDGVQLAKNNNNTMLMMVGGLAALTVGAVIIARKH